MKSTSLLLGIAVIAAGFTSCKDEKETNAEKTVDSYVTYVDSLGNVASADAKQNWESIEAGYQQRTSEAEAALADMKDREAAQARLDASRAKYEQMKAKLQAELEAEQASAAPAAGGALRTTLFGGKMIGNDMAFTWVTKDNIHSVYQQFVHTVENNKDNYSREDWDEIKLLYEALDTRKNTVEKEGLSGDDNRKIAGLKAKFGPMLTVNRMGAKSSENADAKK
ncbi:MAG TPA: hypothetical protein VFQ50_08570 [Flavobacterium sp.]|jgi:hypothetical protein|nr:hypothetical protein [Flavobacterium sp.]